MRRYTLHSPFSIYHFTADSWEHVLHKHTYFEIIFILSGKGMHHINNEHFAYREGDIFLLGPEDSHYFVIEKSTEFSFVRFNESQHRQVLGNEDRPWRPVIKTLLTTPSQNRKCYVEDIHEQKKLRQLLYVLEAEAENERARYFGIIKDSVLRTMLVIIARNLLSDTDEQQTTQNSIEEILLYIKQNIFNPEKLMINHLANNFNHAPSYISIYFKRQTGESLKKYISKVKINLIKSRLQFSELSLTDVAFEFGYTDESHLCKQFRNYTGQTPTQYRKSF